MFDIRRIRLIAGREWTTRLRQRSFQVTTAIQVLVVLLAALSPVLIARFVGDDGPSSSSVVVVDAAEAGIAERITPYMQGDGDALDAIEISTEAADADAARAMVEDDDVDAALVATRDDAGTLRFEMVTESGDRNSTMVQRVYAAASALALEDRLVQSGVDAAEAQEVFTPVTFDVTAADPDDAGDGNEIVNEANAAEYAISYLATILMFIAVVMYGTWIAQGVVEEKSSRIMEIMVNAATPRDLLAGKVIGIMLAGLTQLLPMLLVGTLAFANQPRIADWLDVEVENVIDIDFGGLSLEAGGYFLLFFLLGFILYGALYAGVGSLVSRQEEVNQAITPMMTFMMIGYFGAFFVLGAPESTVAKWLMIFPLTSPFVALPRILLGNPPAMEIILSIVLLVIVAAGAVWLAGRLYRIGVLMYGQRPGWRSLLRMSRMQQVAR